MNERVNVETGGVNESGMSDYRVGDERVSDDRVSERVSESMNRCNMMMTMMMSMSGGSGVGVSSTVSSMNIPPSLTPLWIESMREVLSNNECLIDVMKLLNSLIYSLSHLFTHSSLITHLSPQMSEYVMSELECMGGCIVVIMSMKMVEQKRVKAIVNVVNTMIVKCPQSLTRWFSSLSRVFFEGLFIPLPLSLTHLLSRAFLNLITLTHSKSKKLVSEGVKNCIFNPNSVFHSLSENEKEKIFEELMTIGNSRRLNQFLTSLSLLNKGE